MRKVFWSCISYFVSFARASNIMSYVNPHTRKRGAGRHLGGGGGAVVDRGEGGLIKFSKINFIPNLSSGQNFIRNKNLILLRGVYFGASKHPFYTLRHLYRMAGRYSKAYCCIPASLPHDRVWRRALIGSNSGLRLAILTKYWLRNDQILAHYFACNIRWMLVECV